MKRKKHTIINKCAFGYLLLCLAFASCEQHDIEKTNASKQIQLSLDNIKAPLESGQALFFDAKGKLLQSKAMDLSEKKAICLDVETSATDRILLLSGDVASTLNTTSDTYEEIIATRTPIVDYQTSYPQQIYSVQVNVGSLENTNEAVRFVRSLSRIDVSIDPVLSIDIDSCVIENLVDQSYLFQNTGIPIAELNYTSLRIDGARFASETVQAMTIAQVYESYDGIQPKITFYAKQDGKAVTFKTELPSSLVRNQVYTVHIDAEQSHLRTNVVISPWDDGGSIIIGPDDFAFKLDLDKSVVPSFVRFSDSRDTLYVPSCNTELLLALDTNVETEMQMTGTAISISKETQDDYLGNRFRVRLKQKSITEAQSVTSLYFKEKDGAEYLNQAIVIVQEPARIVLNASNVDIKDDCINYTDYIDGTLGAIKSGFSVSNYTINSDADQYQWVFMRYKGGIYSIEGGFKPNDIHAEGQQQASSIRIRYTDGVEEEYTFSRIRTSLPVVSFNGKYWSKYNMRGNSKDMKDQISFKDEQANLWDYLKSCSDEAFLFYAGDEYAGVNPTGLRLSKNEQGKLTYEGYWDAFGAATISDTKADSHCPSGYEVPSEEDIRSIIGSSVVHLYPLQKGQEDTDAYLVNKQRYTVDRYRRNALLKDGIVVDDVYHLRITNPQGESIVLNGLGFQADPNSVAWGYWLFANVTESRTFVGFNHKGNNFYMQSHSGKKTNLVRCEIGRAHV